MTILKDKKLIQKWLDKYNVKDTTINDDMTVDVQGHVDIMNEELTEILV